MNSRIARRTLLICPIAFLTLSLITTNLQGPFYLGQNLDPEYAVLLNSLNIATLRVPGLYGHPGTPLQEIGAAVLLVKWAGTSCLVGPWEPLERAVLSHPEDYLHALNLVLNLLLSGLLYFAALRVYRFSGSLVAALVFQLSFAVFSQTLQAQARVSLEPLLEIAVLLLVIPAAKLALEPEEPAAPAQEWLAIAVGAALGFGIATKITFLPLFAVVFLFRRIRSAAVCAASSAATTLICILPIWSHFGDMAGWFTSLVTHADRYGQGPTGMPSVSVLRSHVAEMLRYEPMIFILLVVYILVYAAVRFRWVQGAPSSTGPISRLLVAGMLAIVVQIVITAKHFALHYMLPALVFTMLVNAGIIALLAGARPARVARTFYAGVLVVLAFGVLNSARWLVIRARLSEQYRADVRSLQQRRAEMKDCITVGFYRSSSPEFALAFGNDFVNWAYRRELADLYPDAVNYNIWSHQFYSMSAEPRRVALRQAVTKGGCVLMHGGPLPDGDGWLSGFALDPVVTTRSEGLYRLRVVGGALLPEDSRLPADAVATDARAFSSGNVVIDNSQYGVGIGVITAPKYPAQAQYRFQIPSAGRYELRIRCASEEPRPLRVTVDGRRVSEQGCSEPTDGYDPAHQRWQAVAAVELNSGPHTLELYRDGPFPVVSRMGWVQVKP